MASNVELQLDIPIRISNRAAVAIYIHSEAEGDMALVYDRQRKPGAVYADDVISILPGLAHTSNIPHSNVNHWGFIAWRNHRGFVGQIQYGAKHLLWTPMNQHRFRGGTFSKGVFHLLCCQHVLSKQQQQQSNFGSLPLDCLFIVLTFLPHDAFVYTAAVAAVAEDETREKEEMRLMHTALPLAVSMMASYLLAWTMSSFQ